MFRRRKGYENDASYHDERVYDGHHAKIAGAGQPRALDRDHGVVVASVSAETPYSQQGRLELGDVIYSLNGRPVATVGELKAALAALTTNAAAVLQIERESTLMFLAFRIVK